MLRRREWHLKECSLRWLGTVGLVGASPLHDLWGVQYPHSSQSKELNTSGLGERNQENAGLWSSSVLLSLAPPGWESHTEITDTGAKCQCEDTSQQPACGGRATAGVHGDGVQYPLQHNE